ncbi:hypothetical protein SDC9_33699 [bioreactor metagenome]|uniref:Uncharacterized protein n=1 Tax=bioreactor metagenome TaxID=1076179 RepID=A0A644VAD3_9ZZZZ
MFVLNISRMDVPCNVGQELQLLLAGHVHCLAALKKRQRQDEGSPSILPLPKINSLNAGAQIVRN